MTAFSKFKDHPLTKAMRGLDDIAEAKGFKGAIEHVMSDGFDREALEHASYQMALRWHFIMQGRAADLATLTVADMSPDDMIAIAQLQMLVTSGMLVGWIAAGGH